MKFSSLSTLLFFSLGLMAGNLLRAEPAIPDSAGFLRDFYAAYNAQGSAKLADFYAPDATLVDPSFELNLKGREEIGRLLVKVLAKYETLEHEIVRTTAVDDRLIVEGVMVGKLGSHEVHVPFVSIFQFSHGKIFAQHDLFDTLHFMVQLGAFPSPFQPKAGAAGS